MTSPRLTDRAALDRNRTTRIDRAAFFLHSEAQLEIKERLTEVNRTFTKPAIVTGFPDIWSDFFDGADIVPDSDTIDLAPQSYDLVIHAMSLHWANDPVGHLVQCRNALKPDGMFLAVFFGGQTLHELRAALAEAEIALTGGLSPRVVPMGEVRDYGGLLQRAGLALPVADTLPLNTTYASPLHLLHELRAMGEGNALADRRKTFAARSLFSKTAEIYERAFEQDGRIPATFEMIFLSGWAPADSQPKPLRPGSAKTRLEDALKEIAAPDLTLPSSPKD